MSKYKYLIKIWGKIFATIIKKANFRKKISRMAIFPYKKQTNNNKNI